MSDQAPKGFFQGCGTENPSFKASEELKCRLISSYEQALNNGLTPCGALAVILDWAAEECGRIRMDAT